MKCTICHKQYTTACDFNQGRCPHHPPLIDFDKIILKLKQLMPRW